MARCHSRRHHRIPPYKGRGRQIKTTEFPLLPDRSRFTDETIVG